MCSWIGDQRGRSYTCPCSGWGLKWPVPQATGLLGEVHRYCRHSTNTIHATMRKKNSVNKNNASTYMMTPITAIWTEKLFTFWESIRTNTATVPGCARSADLVVTFAANEGMFSKIVTPLAKVHCEMVQCRTCALLPWNQGFFPHSVQGSGNNFAICSHDRAGGTNFSRFQDEL